MTKDLPEAGETWKHYKGEHYLVICLAKLESDATDMVVYRPRGYSSVAAQVSWARPLSEFLVKFERVEF